MSDDKKPAAEPEIPDEIRGKINTPKRPAGYHAINDDLDTPAEDKERPAVRDMKKFWVALAKAIKTPAMKAKISVGADGMPYPAGHVDNATLNTIRSKQYPGAPKLSITNGDLEHDFVEWLYLNHPDDAAVRYFARITHVSKAALDRSLS